jgi:hypothetical protein
MSGSITSHTGNVTSRLERSTLREIGQGEYPQESATIVTPAVTALLTTPQSDGWVTRIGHGSPTEQPQERPAGQMDRAGAGTRQTNESAMGTSAMRALPSHNSSEQRYTLYHVLPKNKTA